MGKKILIVDDAAFMRMMLRDILVVKGFEIVGEAENGIEAGILYRRLKPDLVLMDITMPEMDGIKAVHEILKTDPEARIVMVSAMGQQAMVIQSIKAGAVDFVVKPFHTERGFAPGVRRSGGFFGVRRAPYDIQCRGLRMGRRHV